MVKKTAKQFLRHCVGGFIALIPNFALYALVRVLNVAPGYQTVVPFLIAGQVAFVVHTLWSYKDRAEKKSKLGLFLQWCLFMVGQAAAGSLNYYVAEKATWTVRVQGAYNAFWDACLFWLFGNGHDYWTISFMYYLFPLAAGVAVSFTWTNFVSHRKKKKKTTESPDESRKES